MLVKKPLLKGDLSKHRKECDDLLQSNRYFGASHNIYVARVIHDGLYGVICSKWITLVDGGEISGPFT